MKKFLKNAVWFSLILTFASCQSLNQDKMISTVFQEQLEEISIIENDFSKIDAYCLLNPVTPQEAAEKLSSVNSQIDELLKEEGLEMQARAKLLALKGKALLLCDKKSIARNFYEKASASYKGEVQTVILGFRLGLIRGDIETQKISSEDNALLILEKAINSYREKDFSSSVSKFDEAFLKLEPFYKSNFADVRDSAWNLKDASNVSGTSYQLRDILTVSQMMVLTENETRLLNSYAGSKKISELELYKRLSRAALTFSVSKNAGNELLKDETVTRIKCARFLWNLMTLPYEEKIKYSALFKNPEDNPVKDVDIENPDFNAVLGVIENEIMDLPDGENFYPDKTVSGMEFIKSVKKVR